MIDVLPWFVIMMLDIVRIFAPTHRSMSVGNLVEEDMMDSSQLLAPLHFELGELGQLR